MSFFTPVRASSCRARCSRGKAAFHVHVVAAGLAQQRPAGGLVQLGAGLVRGVGGLGQMHGMGRDGHGVGACQAAGQDGLGHFVLHDGGQVTVVAVGRAHAAGQGVLGQLQGAGVVSGVDVPYQHGGQHIVLGAWAGREHAVQVGVVLGQHGALGFDLALNALQVFQAQAVLVQLGELQLVGGAHRVAVGVCGLGQRRLLQGQVVHAVPLGRCQAHGRCSFVLRWWAAARGLQIAAPFFRAAICCRRAAGVRRVRCSRPGKPCPGPRSRMRRCWTRRSRYGRAWGCRSLRGGACRPGSRWTGS